MTSLLDTEIKRFIEKNITSIEAEDWEKVYEKALLKLTAPEIGDLTQAFLEADVDPLENMTTVPNYYLYAIPIKSLIIPDNIKVISECAFQYCRDLTEVYLPDNLTEIRSYAFSVCSKLKTLYYNRTKEEWNNIFLQALWDDKHPLGRVVLCSDGEIQLD